MSFGSTRRLGMIEHRLYAQHFDFLEGYNCCESAKRNKMARRLASYYDIPVFGGSDAHKENCVGLAGTYLPDYIHSEDDLINYINDGNHPEVGGKRYPKTLKDKIGPAGKFLTYGFYLYNIYGAFRNYPARCRAYFAASAKLKAKMKSNCPDRGLDSKK